MNSQKLYNFGLAWDDIEDIWYARINDETFSILPDMLENMTHIAITVAMNRRAILVNKRIEVNQLESMWNKNG